MKILLGMSGGVDSTYAAVKLKESGHTVEGAVLLMHGYTDISSAEIAAREAGIVLHKIDVMREFSDIVCTDFVKQYNLARTPNPCIICNSEIKFRYLYKYAVENGFDKIATGHYAKVRKNDRGRYYIARGTDTKKDQSYMLWRLPQEILSALVLPLSDMIKENIVEDGKRLGLSSAENAESQEICFIPDGDYVSYIKAHSDTLGEGSFVDKDGNVLGRHKGIINYTVGQRKGLEIALGKRVFVTDIDPVGNTVTLADAPKESHRVYVSGIVFSGMEPPESVLRLTLGVKLRYLAPIAKAEVEVLGDGVAVAYFEDAVRSVTPGQSAVFYDENGCVFGGFIDRSE